MDILVHHDALLEGLLDNEGNLEKANFFAKAIKHPDLKIWASIDARRISRSVKGIHWGGRIRRIIAAVCVPQSGIAMRLRVSLPFLPDVFLDMPII